MRAGKLSLKRLSAGCGTLQIGEQLLEVLGAAHKDVVELDFEELVRDLKKVADQLQAVNPTKWTVGDFEK